MWAYVQCSHVILDIDLSRRTDTSSYVHNNQHHLQLIHASTDLCHSRIPERDLDDSRRGKISLRLWWCDITLQNLLTWECTSEHFSAPFNSDRGREEYWMILDAPHEIFSMSFLLRVNYDVYWRAHKTFVLPVKTISSRYTLHFYTNAYSKYDCFLILISFHHSPCSRRRTGAGWARPRWGGT